ncbi:hypothetical protein [Streptomyces sp. NPDC088801]|uniref:vWA-MoxR associated conflict system protein n=1 Tax=Streptomyces sp. NPDC088801 TaxID=3365903 RepID=UPI003822C2EC
MSASMPLRHALVIAPQNTGLGLLSELEDAAPSLRDALTHHWTGGCTRSPSVTSALLYGDAARKDDIERAVRTAAVRAGEAGAVLVVAFLGHGITDGENPGLHLMAADSQEDWIGSGVDVGQMLTDMLRTPGLLGLIALVDTCHAGGATPDIRALSAGVRRGATRFALLTAVGATEEAHRLAFSRALVQVLGEGVVASGEFLSPAEVLTAVRAVVPDQTAHLVEHDGTRFGEPLWIALNASHFKGIASVLGPIATEKLAEALAPMGGSELLPTPVTDLLVLERLHEALNLRTASDATEMAWALRVVDGLRVVLRTVDLLYSWPGQPLTTDRLKDALRSAAGLPEKELPETHGSELLRDAVEFLRFRARRPGESPTARLAVFVAALAADEGRSEDSPDLAVWARAVGAKVELGDAFEALRKQRDRTRLRLIVSLHAALADEWPETLEAWLVDGGQVHAHETFDCRPDQPGVEAALARALKWGSQAGGEAGALRRVEVAASAPLLLRWRPELTNFGERLGDRYDVVMRWSERLCPPEHLFWINWRAREKLTAMREAGAEHAPVDWLGPQLTRNPGELVERFLRGVYVRAIGLGHRPKDFEQIMEILLAYAPIVLWPGVEGRMPGGCRSSLDQYWNLLPTEFSEAYRRSWGQGVRAAGRGGRDHLALWRSVWHDHEWLDFCDWFGRIDERGEPA